jgi:hypothetical protein
VKGRWFGHRASIFANPKEGLSGRLTSPARQRKETTARYDQQKACPYDRAGNYGRIDEERDAVRRRHNAAVSEQVRQNETPRSNCERTAYQYGRGQER